MVPNKERLTLRKHQQQLLFLFHSEFNYRGGEMSKQDSFLTCEEFHRLTPTLRDPAMTHSALFAVCGGPGFLHLSVPYFTKCPVSGIDGTGYRWPLQHSSGRNKDPGSGGKKPEREFWQPRASTERVPPWA